MNRSYNYATLITSWSHEVIENYKIFEYKNNKRKVSYGEKIDKIEYGKITKCLKKDKSFFSIIDKTKP